MKGYLHCVRCTEQKTRSTCSISVNDNGDIDIVCDEHHITFFHACNSSVAQTLLDIAKLPCPMCEEEGHHHEGGVH